MNLELSIDIDKQEEISKETFFEESLLTEIEVSNKQEIIVETVPEVEAVVIPSIEIKTAPEITEQKEQELEVELEPVAIEQEIIVETVPEMEVIKNTEVKTEEVTKTEEKVKMEEVVTPEKMLTLEERIIELLKDEDEQIEEISEQVQILETTKATEQVAFQLEETEKVVVMDKTEKHTTTEETNKINTNEVANISKEIPVILNQLRTEKANREKKEYKEVKNASIEKAQATMKIESKEIKKIETREAIVLNINNDGIKKVVRSEQLVFLEDVSIEIKTQNESKDESKETKPLDGHEVLLQILGISQNATELKNTKPMNHRSVPNINQEEQENKSIKLIPSIYQQRNLNGITLKIAA